MADRKISDLTALTTPATGDLLPIVDISEGAAADKNKSITVGELLRGAPDGTAAAPGIAFESDGGNGMFLGGTDILAFSTGGTQAVTIDASQRLGIGDSDPNFKLDVNGDVGIREDNNLTFHDGTGTAAFRIRGGSDNKLYFERASGHESQMVIDDGKVGVGTTSPSSALQVNGIIRAQRSDDSNPRYTQISFEGGISSLDSVRNDSQFEAIRFRQSADNGSNYTERMRIDSSGRVGIGTSSPGEKMEIGGTSSAKISLRANNDSTGVSGLHFGDTSSAVSGRLIYNHSDDSLAFYTNSAERARIDSSGRLGIGTTSPDGNVHIADSTRANLILKKTGLNDLANSSLANEYDTIQLGAGGSFASYNVETVTADTHIGHNFYAGSGGALKYKYSDAAARIRFNSNQGHIIFDRAASGSANASLTFSESIRIDSSGRLLVGSSSGRSIDFINAALQVDGTTTATSAINLTRNANSQSSAFLQFAKSRGTSNGSSTVVQSGDVLGYIQFAGADGTDVETIAANIRAEVDGTPGSNDMPGRLVFSTTADGASSPTTRFTITSTGSFVGGGHLSEPSVNSTTQFNCLGPEGYVIAARNSDPALYVGRNTDDGDLVEFRQAGTQEGSISVSGTTVSYNGAHLSRWSQLPGGVERTEILRGSVLSNIDEMCEWGEEENEQLNRMQVSNIEGDRNVAGVFQAWDDDDDTYTNDFYCAMTGDFIIRIAQGVMVERGDLLMSAGDGTAKPQEDDIIRSKTIAKVTSTNVSCTYDDGSYCVPCVLMAC